LAETVTLVTGRVDPDRHAAVVRQYEEGTAQGLPTALEETFLLRNPDCDQLAIMTVWATRQELDAMLATGEEPFARRLIRTAGGTPEVHIFDVVLRVR
jgi:hypothetical protein